MGGLSGHAGQDDLVRWFDSLAASRPRVILTHGEDKGAMLCMASLRNGTASMPSVRDYTT
jgi:predicted metal-dependent RNase